MLNNIKIKIVKLIHRLTYTNFIYKFYNYYSANRQDIYIYFYLIIIYLLFQCIYHNNLNDDNDMTKDLKWKIIKS